VHPDVVAGVRVAAELLTTRGHTIEESHPAALDGLFGSLGDLPKPVSSMQTELTYRWLEERVGRPLEHGDIDAPLLGTRPALMPTQTAVDDAVEVVTARFEAALEWWDDFDVMLMPAMRQPAWPLGNSDWDAVGILPMEFTHIGFASLVLPIGMTEDGLPLAVQLTGRHGADRQLLELAAQLEADAPWADRWPPLVEG
jgi:Asp-tRNA(Asn)/Glu-tRNA(Gln) amidotransferase A subunit family amidase